MGDGSLTTKGIRQHAPSLASSHDDSMFRDRNLLINDPGSQQQREALASVPC